ncbi:P-loop containing nucleoside triphosphate hydrolase protein, partial [Sistotremastrum suecicum HHB10207 ss-3]
FRQKYSELGNLRSFVPSGTPLLAASATFPPNILADVIQSLDISDKHLFINLGNFRRNLKWETRNLKSAARGHTELRYVLTPGEPGQRKPIEQTLIYVNAKDESHYICNDLRSQVAPDKASQEEINVYHASHSSREKAKLLQDFKSGKIKILICTEAAGMGCDFPRISLVIQYRVPDSLTSWLQRAGRGGRSSDSICRCIIMVEPSFYNIRSLSASTSSTSSTDSQQT